MSGKYVIAGVAGFIALVALVFVVDLLVSNGDDDDITSSASGDQAAVGERIYRQQCVGCHTIDGSSAVGPSLEGLYGSEVTMDDGSTVHVDYDHLYEAITDPRATTREGFPDVMPTFSNLQDDEIDGLIVFIESLQ